MVVSPDSVVYGNTWSGLYYGFDTPPAGGFLVALQDTDGDGKADRIERFGDGVPEKATGGTGIALYNDALFAEQNDYVLRFALATGNPVRLRAQLESDNELLADAERIEYRLDALQVVLSGNARVRRGEDEIRAQQIVYGLTDGSISASGADEGDGRVRAIIHPNQKNDAQ
jgi:lipopolysaccharide transport protein LptA